MFTNITSPKTHLRISGITEGISFLLLLLVAMPLKYMAGMPEAVKVAGMIHGVLFIWYVSSSVWAKGAKCISSTQMIVVVFASIIPFGTFWADKKIFRSIS